jgi:glycosyltransferase involved in cell wall biosynthesis
MQVSVVIGSYRPGKCLYRCIKSLSKQTRFPDELIIGVDSIQEDQNFSAEPEIPYRFVASGKSGVSAARNAACEQATGDILAFIDDDATGKPDWIENIHRVFNDPTVSCVGGPVIPVFERGSMPEQWYWIIGCTGISRRPICSNMAIRRSDFMELGGFPESLGRIKRNLNIGEETELLLNLEKVNKKIVWEPGMVVHHWCPSHRTQLPYILSRAYKEGIGKAMIGKRYALDQEYSFLKHYLSHPDKYTILVLLATGFGFIRGHFKEE